MLSVELTICEVFDPAVVVLHGELDLADIPMVASHLIAAAAACGSIIVDLTGLAYISYEGLGMLGRAQTMTRALGGELSLAAPKGQVRVVLETTGLMNVFPVYPTVEHALRRAAPALPAGTASRWSSCRVTEGGVNVDHDDPGPDSDPRSDADRESSAAVSCSCS
jgi:anti-sigma B factor antagonist